MIYLKVFWLAMHFPDCKGPTEEDKATLDHTLTSKPVNPKL